MTDARADAPIIYSGSFVVTADYPAKAANAFVRFSFSLPRQIVFWVLCLVLALISVILFAADSSHKISDLWFPFAIIIAFVFVVILRRSGLKRQLETNAVPGAIYELALTPETLSVRTPTAASSVRYNYYEKLDVRGDFVFLKIRNARIRSIMPRQLFTPESLEYARSRVEGRVVE